MTNWVGKNILITGAASGLGKRLALRMAQTGGQMLLWDIDRDRLEEVRQQIERQGSFVRAYVCDLSQKEHIEQNLTAVREDAGEVDILINNAGIVSGKRFLECSEKQITRTFAVNTMAVVWLTRALLPSMIQRNAGHIVTISSAGGLIGTAGLADYSASKFAVFGFQEALRNELRKRKVDVKTTMVCPYFINTGMFEGVKTRFPFLLPILEEEKVVDKILRAIQKEKRELLMPALVHTVMPLRILPTWLFDAIADFLGVNDSMNHFVGREGKKGS